MTDEIKAAATAKSAAVSSCGEMRDASSEEEDELEGLPEDVKVDVATHDAELLKAELEE